MIRIALLLGTVSIMMLACGAAEPVVSPQTPTEPSRAGSPCGDGVCDEIEQKDPSLCPQDCPGSDLPTEPVPATVASEPEPAARCGDGVCDEAETKGPSLCPKDCDTPTPVPPTSEPPTPEPATTVDVLTPTEVVVTEAATPTETPAATDTPPTEPTAAPAQPAEDTVVLPSGELAFLGDPGTVNQGKADAGGSPQSNLALILDGSGSMGEALPGTGKTKLAVAKEVMAELIPQIPAELNGTLWIYAHRYPPDPKADSCQDIEQVLPLEPVDAGAYVTKIQGIQANGWTPIADSIVAAADGLPVGDFNSVILVSDGEETCGGDPCAVSEALKGSDAELTIHVVGYAVDDATREQLACIARVSGGSYHDATDAEGLLDALEEALAAAVVETVLRVEIVDPGERKVREQILLREAGAEQVQSYYGTWKDNVVPAGSYDLQVLTLPNIVYPALDLPEGSTTVVRIVLGSLSVLTPDGEPVAAEYHEAGTGTDLGYWGHEGPVVLAPGTYTVSANQATSAPVTVQAGEATEVVLGTIQVLAPDGALQVADFWEAGSGQRLGSYGHEGPAAFVPGTYLVEVNKSTSGPISLESGVTVDLLLGGILVLALDGQPEAADFWDASAGQRLGSYGYAGPALFVPGTYVVDVRGSRTEPITLEDGQLVEVQLGAVHADGSYTIWDAEGNRLGAYGDTLLLVPGIYKLELADGEIVDGVVVEAGEVTEVQ